MVTQKNGKKVLSRRLRDSIFDKLRMNLSSSLLSVERLEFEISQPQLSLLTTETQLNSVTKLLVIKHSLIHLFISIDNNFS